MTSHGTLVCSSAREYRSFYDSLAQYFHCRDEEK